ncbi:MAG: hypothetical protein H6724_03870 [Sandaracinus sp.]|nr:hypothetical protein [Sandaracinus sp.]
MKWLRAWCLLALTSGCMLGPYDDMEVSSRDQEIDFTGFHLRPNQEVRVQAFNQIASRWETLETLRSATTPTPTDLRDTLYGWNTRRRLTRDYWAAGTRGAKAQVRALTVGLTGDDFEMVSVDADWGACYRENRTASDFQRNCAAKERR